MTPLSDALTAAQRAALTALGKSVTAGTFEGDNADLFTEMDAMGCADKVEQAQLVNAWSVLRANGSGVPSEQNGAPKEAPMSDGQRGFIADLLQQKNVAPDDFPDTTGLTQVKASELINDLKYGKYDPAKWKVPF